MFFRISTRSRHHLYITMYRNRKQNKKPKPRQPKTCCKACHVLGISAGIPTHLGSLPPHPNWKDKHHKDLKDVGGGGAEHKMQPLEGRRTAPASASPQHFPKLGLSLQPQAGRKQGQALPSERSGHSPTLPPWSCSGGKAFGMRSNPAEAEGF